MPLLNEVLGNIRIGKGFTENDIRFVGKGRKEMAHTSAKAEKLLAVKYLREILENSNFVTEAASAKEKHDGEHFYYIHSALNINGIRQYVIANIIQLRNCELIYYNHNVFNENEYKKIEDALKPSSSVVSSTVQNLEQQSSFKNSVTQKRELYKQQNIVQVAKTAKRQIAQQDDGSYIVSLFNHADASTVIHETGHYFVDTLINEAVANPENPADWLRKNELRFENAGKKTLKNDWMHSAFIDEYENTADFIKEIASLDKNEFNKRSYKYKHKNSGIYEVLSSNFGHVKKGTPAITPEQWDDILIKLDSVDSIEEIRISDVKGLHGGIIAFQKVKGALGTYGIITEFSTSGRVFVTTAGIDGEPNVNIDNWAKKVRGSQILQQKA